MIFLVLQGKVGTIDGVDGFWRLFRKILARKIIAVRDREAAIKRNGEGIPGHGRNGKQAGGSMAGAPTGKARARIPDDLDLFESGLPSVEVLAVGDELTARLLAMLSEDLASVMRMRFEGRSIPMIAATLEISTRTVDRRLEQIRAIWGACGLCEGLEEGAL